MKNKPTVRWRRWFQWDWKRWLWIGVIDTQNGESAYFRFIESCELDTAPEPPNTETIEWEILKILARKEELTNISPWYFETFKQGGPEKRKMGEEDWYTDRELADAKRRVMKWGGRVDV